MRGKFITIEGPDGAGKTTQAKKIAKYLKERGKDVVMTREPEAHISVRASAISCFHLKVNLPNLEAEALIYAASRGTIGQKNYFTFIVCR